MNPELSICIPTFKRNELVIRLIEYISKSLTAINFDFCISDNDPESRLQDYIDGNRNRLPPINYFKNSENIGPMRNMMQSIDRSTGDLCVLCCDDDVVIPEILSKKIRFLQDNPNFSAVYGPHLFEDAGAKMPAFTDRIIDVERSDGYGLINTLHNNRIVPESSIFRAKEIRNNLSHNENGYFYIDLIKSILEAGNIRFDPEPFYVTTSDSAERHSHPMLQRISFWQSWENSLNAIAGTITDAENKERALVLSQKYVNKFRINLINHFVSENDDENMIALYEKVSIHSMDDLERGGLSILYQMKKIKAEIKVIVEKNPDIGISFIGESPLFDQISITESEMNQSDCNIFVFADASIAELCRDMVGEADFSFTLPSV